MDVDEISRSAARARACARVANCCDRARAGGHGRGRPAAAPPRRPRGRAAADVMISWFAWTLVLTGPRGQPSPSLDASRRKEGTAGRREEGGGGATRSYFPPSLWLCLLSQARALSGSNHLIPEEPFRRRKGKEGQGREEERKGSAALVLTCDLLHGILFFLCPRSRAKASHTADLLSPSTDRPQTPIR